MAEIVVFGGTSEGREIAALLKARHTSALVCVATEYGEALLQAGGSLLVHAGRLGQAEIEALLSDQSPRMVIDATHPYADKISRNLRAACAHLALPLVRVRREASAPGDVLYVDGMEEMIAWLNTTKETIFSAIGAKEAPALTRVSDFRERVWLRILPFQESLDICVRAGFPPRHLICMQGPFSRELNEAMFRATGAGILLSKESGDAGGFEEKLLAARACGMQVALLSRPNEEEGFTLDQVKRMLQGEMP